MTGSLPNWFAAESLFEGMDGWYIGSPNGFCAGPYPNEGTAEAQSMDLKRRLTRCRNGGDRLRIVRAFIAEQSGDEKHTERKIEVRAGESNKRWFRSDRCFSVDGLWYFLTREGIDVGPYETRFGAETDARRLIRLLKKCSTDEQRRLAIYEFVRRPIGMERP